jgi:hypothetical protein
MRLKFRSMLALAFVLAACSPQPATTVPTPGSDAADTAGPDDAKVDTGKADAGKDAATDVPDAASPDAADVGSDAEPGDVPEDGSDAEPVDSQDADSTTDLPDVGPDASVDGQDTADAGDVATPDAGPVAKATYPSACTTTADCLIPCAAGPCIAGKCKFSALKGANGWLLDDGGDKVQCLGAGDPSDVAACLVCTPSVSQTVLSPIAALRALEGPADGVVTAIAYSSAFTWNYSDKRSKFGAKSLYFGDPTTHTYSNGKRVASTATLPALQVPASPMQPKIGFWLWLDTEETQGKDVVTLTVVAGGESKAAWTSNDLKPLLGTTKKDGAGVPEWRHVLVDASQWAGKPVQLIFSFDSDDGTLNAFEGAYLDDVSVETGCCGSAGDCDDDDTCTADTCGGPASAPVCSHAAKADCCDNASDCNDQQVCTFDQCNAGACTHTALPDCCTVTAECNDGDDCTHDECGGDHKCQHSPTCCQNDADCKSSDACEIPKCIAGSCALTVICCSGEADCDDFNTCTKDACSAGKCVYTASAEPGCCAPVVLNSAFNGTVEGWTSSAAQSGLDWHYKDFANAKSAPGVLHFGDPAKVFSISGAKIKVTAASPPISLLAGNETVLTYQLWGDVTNGYNMTIRTYVLVDNAEVTLTSTAAANVQGSWHPFTVDLTPIAGKSFQLFFEITTNGFGSVGGQGVYLDDVSITSTCVAKKCTSSFTCGTGTFTCLAGTCADGKCGYSNGCCKTDTECNDNSPCTQDKCSGGKCSFAAIAGCCVGDGDCNDANACTTDVCPGAGKQCSFTPKAACCLASKDCNDNVACTTDVCSANKCVNTNFCCKVDKDCDDGETKCTTDTCVSQNCVHQPTGAPGCCVPEVWSNAFDTGDAKDIVFANSAGATKGWQIWGSAKQTKSGTGAMYYGNPSTGDYDFGASSGTATTPKIQLPALTPSSLSLQLLMDTEGSTTYDNLVIYVVVDGQKKQVFTKNAPGFNTSSWFEVKADLSAYLGKEIQILFDFNTGDSVANSTDGVFVDDIKITTKCN